MTMMGSVKAGDFDLKSVCRGFETYPECSMPIIIADYPSRPFV